MQSEDLPQVAGYDQPTASGNQPTFTVIQPSSTNIKHQPTSTIINHSPLMMPWLSVDHCCTRAPLLKSGARQRIRRRIVASSQRPCSAGGAGPRQRRRLWMKPGLRWCPVEGVVHGWNMVGKCWNSWAKNRTNHRASPRVTGIVQMLGKMLHCKESQIFKNHREIKL